MLDERLARALRGARSGDISPRMGDAVRPPRSQPEVPALAEAASALRARNVDTTARIVDRRLAEDPADPEALRLRAAVMIATGATGDAEHDLRQAIALRPDFVQAHADLCTLLRKQGRDDEAIGALDTIWERDRRLWALSLKTAILDGMQRTGEALPAHETLLAHASGAAIPWLNYGNALATLGRGGDAIAAYRRALALEPGNGFAWWALANLRTVRLGPVDIAVMERAIRMTGGGALNRVQLHFALGKALGDERQFERSFAHYAAANALRGKLAPYDAAAMRAFVTRAAAIFTPDRLAVHRGGGCEARDAIFIVGMPRSGSTLIEQILASHPQIEGLGELTELSEIAAEIGGNESPAAWLDAIARRDPHEWRAIGQRYLASVRRYRKSDRPFFTDKMPANWQYIGLIHLMFPNARIIDVRRDMQPCCFSSFTTYFNLQTQFPTDLKELGEFYRDYVRMIEHFQQLLPERILNLQYERIVDDLEREVRRMLAYLALPFDAACLHFHQNPRSVRTPSAEQVRQPINRAGLERWRGYEPWLGRLQSAISP